MTVSQTRKILVRIQECERDLEELRRVRRELATNPYVSATISSQGGSKSYTRQDIGKVMDIIRELEKELAQLQSMVSIGSGGGWKTIATVYC